MSELRRSATGESNKYFNQQNFRNFRIFALRTSHRKKNVMMMIQRSQIILVYIGFKLQASSNQSFFVQCFIFLLCSSLFLWLSVKFYAHQIFGAHTRKATHTHKNAMVVLWYLILFVCICQSYNQNLIFYIRKSFLTGFSLFKCFTVGVFVQSFRSQL